MQLQSQSTKTADNFYKTFPLIPTNITIINNKKSFEHHMKTDIYREVTVAPCMFMKDSHGNTNATIYQPINAHKSYWPPEGWTVHYIQMITLINEQKKNPKTSTATVQMHHSNVKI